MPLPAGIMQAIAAVAKLISQLIRIIPMIRVRLLKKRLQRQRRRNRKLKQEHKNGRAKI